MDNHPELGAETIEVIAAQLPTLTRLIYVDVDDFSTQPQQTIDLYRGHMKAKVQVVEIKNGKATVAFTSDTIEVVDPPGTPAEGTTISDQDKLYSQTVDDFTTEAAKLFVPHPAEDSDP
jgi:hypothetical protein